jgi:putative FmdB family regulatory protein
MAMYEYQCEAHGVFEAVRSLHEAALPEPCPDCGHHAARILSAPHLAQVSGSERVARDRNERSSHEPRLVKGPAYGKPDSKKPQRDPEARPALRRSHNSRPWALEHS